MAFIDDLELAKESDRDFGHLPAGEKFVDDLGLADEKPPAKKKTKGAFDEFGITDASETKSPPPDPSGQSAFAEFGSPEPEPRSLLERAGRLVTHDLPRLLTLRTPSGPSVPAAPPEESVLAASGAVPPVAEAPAPEALPAPSRSLSAPEPVATGPIPESVPAGPLSRARELMTRQDFLATPVPREIGSQQEVMGIAGVRPAPGIYAAQPETAPGTLSDISKGIRQTAAGFAAFPVQLAEHVAEFAIAHPFFSAYAKEDPEAAKGLREAAEKFYTETTEAFSQGATPGSGRVAGAFGDVLLPIMLPGKVARAGAEALGASEFTSQVLEDASILATFGVIRKGSDLIKLATRKTTKEFQGAPETVNISAEKVKDIFQTGEKISAEEQSLISSLGWTAKEYRDAITRGVLIETPAPVLLKTMDRPIWAKVKEKLGMKPGEVVYEKVSGGGPRKAMKALPEAAKAEEAGAVSTEPKGEIPAEAAPVEPAAAAVDNLETAKVLRKQDGGEILLEEQKQPPPSAPTRLFTRERDTKGGYVAPDFKAIVDKYYDVFPSAHDQPRSLVEWSARETWKRNRGALAGPDTPDQTLFERMNARIAAEMKEPPASAPAPPATPDATVEPPATDGEEGILGSEAGFLDVSPLAPGVNAARDVKAGITSLLLPTAKSPEHLRAAEVLGSKLGSMHRDAEAAAQSLGKDSRTFDKLGVHDPDVPLRDNPGVKFMSHRERKYLSPEIQKIGDKVQNLFDDRVRKLETAGAAMRTVRENYFPGMWTQESIKAFNKAAAEVATGMEAEGRKAPETYEDWSTEDRAAVKARVQEILKGGGKGSDKSALAYLSRRQLKGKESFRKPKVFDDIMDGIDFGLVPISKNPIDLVKLKLAEMDRSIMANRALREWEKAGDVKFLRTGQQMPEGFAKINDKYGTVYGPPTQTMTEHVDKAVYDGLMKVASDIGLSPERKYSAGRSKLGYASPSGETVTQFATELSVLAHEIGHQIDFQHGLWDKIVAGAVDVGKRGKVTETASAAKRAKIQNELRALADLSWEGSEASDYYKKKVRKKAEKMAHMLEAYIHAPDRFKEVAPTVYSDFDAFVKNHDELKGLSEIKQGLALEKISVEKSIGGFPVIGSRIAKKPVAEILNNFLSSSIYNSPHFGTAFKGYMGMANALNQSQLGLGSAFHAGFTSADVQISHNAEVIKDIYGLIRGNRTLGDLGRTIKKVPAAMITNPRRGAKVVAEWRTPTLEVPTNVPVGKLPQGNDARVAMIAKAMELAGGASRLEHGLKTEWTEKQVREWYGNQKIRAAARTPIVLVELMAKPIMEWLVPRQKAGVFGELAGRIIEQNPGKTMEQLTPQFRQAWNRVDARLGQVVYDRLFINNIAKNVIQGAIRAPGWTGGTIGEVITGAPKDFVNFFEEWWRTKKAPENIPDRVAYVIALIGTVMTVNYLLTKAFTGEDPEGMDWWAFRTSAYDEQGKAERFILPTYAKDLFAWWEDWGHTLVAKTHPLLGVIGDIYRNHDYYGVKIRNEDDPAIKQLADSATYGLKQFEPFWIRGAKKEIQRGGGLEKTITEEPQKILAPQLGIMPATSAYTMTPFEKYARKMLEERRPRGTRTKEEAERGDRKRVIEQKLRRGDTDAKDELLAALRSGDITRREAQEINQRSGEDYTTKIAKSMTLEDLAAGIKLASDREKALIKPIFVKKIRNKTGQIDGKTRDRYIDILRDM